ncbi:MAG: hypothetical protein JNN02_06170 [Tabrizicola sp.]|nr:hypothetical protein [Tabrizicola sp.]
MRNEPISFLRKWALMALLTVALVATGFAHRMPSQEDQALELAVANGLTAADLCGDTTPGKAHAGPHCLACQIAGTADLPPDLSDLQDLDLVFLATISAPRESRLVARVLDPANSPQGPPAA